MNEIVNALVDAARWIGRRSRSQWALRVAMLVCGVAAQMLLVPLQGVLVLEVIGWVAIVAAVLLPRTILPLISMLLQILLAATASASVWQLLPVGFALVGWHVCAAALALGRPWARFDRAVWRQMGAPAMVGAAAVGIAVPVALITSAVTLPGSLAVAVLIVLVIGLGVAVVLWPTPTAAARRVADK